MGISKHKSTPLLSSFSSLKIRNYRLYFIGSLFSLFGDMMQRTAQGYLIYEITNSPSFLGLVTFANGLPAWILMLFAGVLIDRILIKRNLIVLTQVIMMVLAFVLAGLVFTNKVEPWHIIALALLLGITNAFNMPARQAFVADLVPKEEMANAIALNSMMFNLARVIGPTAAGIAYATMGPAWCFFINAITFIFIIAALILMRFDKPSSPNKEIIQTENHKLDKTHEPILKSLKQSFAYIWNDKVTFWLIVGVFMIGFGIGGFITLFPVWATDVLHGGVEYNGYLISFRGFGSVIGALLLASLSRYEIKGKLFTIGSILTPSLMILFTFTRTLSSSLTVLVFMGAAFMLFINTCNSIVQTRVADELRGRVMSVYSLSLIGAFSLGGLIIALVADRLNTPTAMLISSSLLLLFSVSIFIFFPKLRHEK